MFLEMTELQNEQLVKQLNEQLSSHEFWFNSSGYKPTAAEREALINFVGNFMTKVDQLWVDFNEPRWSENEMKKFLDVIKSSNIEQVCLIFIFYF